MSVKLTFDQANERTFRSEKSFIRAPYQLATIAMLLLSDTCTYPMVHGLSFLEKLPSKFECLQVSAH